tara:strand:+ start:176 stop:664 length:489 start_codon:yes stop_codon:yes gene_type:complete
MAQDSSFSDGADSALYLGAVTAEDLEVISSILQDGIFCTKDLVWSKKKRQVAVLINRFRWECKSEYIDKNSTPERVQSLLIIDNVLNISSQGIDRSDSTEPLNLLKLDLQQTKKNFFLKLILSNFGAIRCELDAIELSMKDVTRPYNAYSERIPFHPIIDES